VIGSRNRPAAVSKCLPQVGELRCETHQQWRTAFDLQRSGQSYAEALALLPTDEGAWRMVGQPVRSILANSADRSAFLESHGAGGQYARHQQLIARLQQLLS
jgi:hypothetical protein